jgi:wyosine [tRNA(Phe)-imidazoG37] synthetase (radical SAM superfamily)
MQILDEFLPTCEQLSLMSSGEPFASPSTREIFLRVNRLPEPPKIWLMTNGLLMPREWPLYWNLHDRLEWIFQSIDAATAQTYEAVRRPATWQQLEKSFRYLEAIRREHPFSWQLNFVVQAANFHEMPRFVQLGIDLGATTVHFARILRLYHSQDQFSEMDVCAESHPQHQPFLRTIEHPIMKHSIVLAPTIQEFMA